jgi:hypothetical protein
MSARWRRSAASTVLTVWSKNYRSGGTASTTAHGDVIHAVAVGIEHSRRCHRERIGTSQYHSRLFAHFARGDQRSERAQKRREAWNSSERHAGTGCEKTPQSHERDWGEAGG